MAKDENIKEAKVPVKDPVQSHLRQHKHEWSLKAKTLRISLALLSRSVNGKPVPALSLPKGKITDPLPSQIEMMSKRLKAEFLTLFEDLDSIVAEQAEYASQRQERIKERGLKAQQPIQPATEQPAQNTAITSSADDQLIKEASNPFTRLFTYIKTPFIFGDKDRWAKLKLLRISANLNKILIEVDSNLLDRSRFTIPKAVYVAKDFVHKFEHDLINRFISLLTSKAVVPVKELSEGEPPKENAGYLPDVEEMAQKVSNIQKEVMKLEIKINELNLEPQLKRDIDQMVGELTSSQIRFNKVKRTKNPFEIQNSYNRILELYDLLIKTFNKLSVSMTTAGDNPYLIKEASTALTRWIQEKFLRISTKRDATLRLAAHNSVASMRGDLDSFMNSLQKNNASTEELTKSLINISVYLKNLLTYLNELADVHNNSEKLLRSKRRSSGEKSLPELIPEPDRKTLMVMVDKIERLINQIKPKPEININQPNE